MSARRKWHEKTLLYGISITGSGKVDATYIDTRKQSELIGKYATGKSKKGTV